MPAKLPESLLNTPPRYTIATMPVGSEYEFAPWAMTVDEDLNCWLNPDEKAGTSGFIAVRRAADGYHVRMKSSIASWERQSIPEERKTKLLPVASVSPYDGGKERR